MRAWINEKNKRAKKWNGQLEIIHAKALWAHLLVIPMP
jgi:hypothetical protein